MREDNLPVSALQELLTSLAINNPGMLAADLEAQMVYRAEKKDTGHVALVAASAAAYLPDPIFYVGPGMLDAACIGSFDAPPAAETIYAATCKVETGAGALYIIRNDAQERASFAGAAELAQRAGIHVLSVVIDDEIAKNEAGRTTERQSAAGTIFAYKLVGAAAEQGESLESLVELADLVNDMTRTCVITSAEKSEKDLLQYATKAMTDRCVDDLPYLFGDEVAVMVSGFGSVSGIEQYRVAGAAMQDLQARGIDVYRSYISSYYSRGYMNGVSLSLLKLNEKLKTFLDAPVQIPYRVF